MTGHDEEKAPDLVIASNLNAADVRLDERSFRALIAHSPMSTQIYAPDGTTLLVNRAWEDLWGVQLLEIGDYNILRDPQLIALGVMPQIARGFAGEPTTLPPIRYDPTDSIVGSGTGRVRWVRAVIYPVKDDAGRVREVVVQYEDVTERVLAQHLLEERVAARTEELTTLLEVARLLSSTLELAPLLDLILDQLGRVVPSTGAALWLIDDHHLIMVADRAPAGQALPPGLRIPTNHAWWADTAPRPAIVADVQDERDQSPAAVSYRAAVGGRFGYSRAWLRVPLVHRDRPIGLLSLSHAQPGYYTPHHAELALAIGSQAAAAIENARLFGRAQEVAALEERQRLARELHDSVTQALFSATLHARAAQLALDRAGQAPETPAARAVGQLRALTQGALAEMRALIFELRPGALAEEGLGAALTKHAAALAAREDLPVQVSVPDGRLQLDPATEEHLYRLAQEALNNVVKHAQARHVWIRLDQASGNIILELADDGVGFDPARERPGHLGLGTMTERARAIGATLTIDSIPGQGTTVRVAVPERHA